LAANPAGTGLFVKKTPDGKSFEIGQTEKIARLAVIAPGIPPSCRRRGEKIKMALKSCLEFLDL
jgi:hypothetical protein